MLVLRHLGAAPLRTASKASRSASHRAAMVLRPALARMSPVRPLPYTNLRKFSQAHGNQPASGAPTLLVRLRQICSVPPPPQRSRPPVPIHPGLAILVLALLLSIQPVTTDPYLPALPALTRSLGAPMAAAQLTLSGLLLAFGCSQMVWGPLSDRFGRCPSRFGRAHHLHRGLAGQRLCADHGSAHPVAHRPGLPWALW